MPQELGLETHAVLYDAEQHPGHVPAMGHGGDEAEALLDLWATLSKPSQAPWAAAIGRPVALIVVKGGEGLVASILAEKENI
jgi:hypothetical protein